MHFTTKNLTLREFREDDFDALLAYQGDPRYLQYYGEAERPEEFTRSLHRWFVDHQADEPRYRFQLAITLRDDDRLIGNVGVRKPKPDAVEAEMGCEFAADYWNRGYATEANRAMLRFGFQDLQLHRLWAGTNSGKGAAQRVLEKLGMRREGELRETTWMGDHWANTIIYGILEDEWRSLSEPTRPV